MLYISDVGKRNGIESEVSFYLNIGDGYVITLA